MGRRSKANLANPCLLAPARAIATTRRAERVRRFAACRYGTRASRNLEEFRAHLAGLPLAEAISIIEQLLIKHVAGIVGMPLAKLTVDGPLLDLGMDSLMLVEL
jgi:hypothetical protein